MDMVIISTAPEKWLEMEIIPNCSTFDEAHDRRTLESSRWYITGRDSLIELLEEKLKYLKGQADNVRK